MQTVANKNVCMEFGRIYAIPNSGLCVYCYTNISIYWIPMCQWLSTRLFEQLHDGYERQFWYDFNIDHINALIGYLSNNNI